MENGELELNPLVVGGIFLLTENTYYLAWLGNN
jgi:hypothetical protein